VTVVAPSEVKLPLDRDSVERLSRGRGEPDWLLDARLAALARFEGTAWPTGKEEEWRAFPLKDLPRPSLGMPGPSGAVYTTLPDPDTRRGVVFLPLSEAVKRHADLVRRWAGPGAEVASHRAFQAFAVAACSEGSTFLYVPRGVDVSVPLSARTTWSASEAAIALRTVVVADEGSRVTFIDELVSEDGPPRLAVPLLEVHAGPGAQVRYVQVQRFGAGVWNVGAQSYVSERDSRLESFNVLVGSSRTKLGVTSDIRGDGAEVKLNGLVAGGDAQHLDVNSFQRLDGKASQSDLLYLSALYESAKAIYYGVIRVEPTSSGTGSYQECRNLLLSDKAGAHPTPVLEILTNDVARCGHGATAGRMQEDEVFYVMTRGIDRRTAEQLLVRGSFARVLDRIPDASVRARVLEALRPRIGSIAEIDLAA
jgi:Fe-S cluster assembly protein SufD